MAQQLGSKAQPSDGFEAESWREILDFERAWWRTPTAKSVAVRERFGLSPTRYYQVLNRILDHPEALEYDPMLVQRLRRLREARRRKRYVGPLAPGGEPGGGTM